MGEQENLQDNETTFRERQAEKVPFFLRAWWLRNYVFTDDSSFAEAGLVTGMVGSIYSDPVCDLGNWDLP